MIFNQLVLEFLGREVVIVLMYAFWLMLGLVLFNGWKEFVDFIKIIANAIWSGMKWVGFSLWFALVWIWTQLVRFFKWIWKGLRWVGKKLSFIWDWIAKVAKLTWNFIKKVSLIIANFFVRVWNQIVIGFKLTVQFSWWLIAGIAIAIGETTWLVIRTLGLGLWGGVHLLKEGFRWVFMPVYFFYKWLINDKPMKAYRFDLNPLWVETQRWFHLHFRTLIFKTGAVKKQVVKKDVAPVAKPVVKVVAAPVVKPVVKEVVKPVAKPIVNVQPEVKVVEKKVEADDAIVIASINEVNQNQVNKVKAAIAREEAMDDVSATKEARAFETRKIFLKGFTAKADFYNRLTPALQTEFSNLFIKEGSPKMIPEVSFVIGQTNQAFFDKVFNFIFRLRKTLSLGLLTAMVEEGLRLADQDAATKTNINEAGIRVAYARRSNPNYLKYAEKLAREDIALHQTILKTKNTYVYSVKRLAIILEKREAIDEAITLVKSALANGLKDQTIGEYRERLLRLQAQLLIMEAKKKGLFVEKVETAVVTSNEPGTDEEDEAKTVDLSKVVLKKTAFYESLTPVLKAEFDRLFVLEGVDHLVKGLQFNRGQNNNAFFQNVFNSLYAYRKVISFDLLTALYEEMTQQLSGQSSLITTVNEATIRIMFYRRKETIFLDQCEALCQEDIALHLDVLKTRSGFVYSFKRLAILLEKQGLYDDAIAMCDRAINLNLDDKTQGGYGGRKERILKRQAQQVKVGE
jgi:tetratricopeptide (TPR) repeat protein